MKAQTITIFNQKGGSGKTPTAVQLAFALVRAGKRVLFIDADPQGTATLHFHGISYKDLDSTFFNAITSTRDIERITKIEPLVIQERLHLLPAHDELEQAEVLLTSKRTFEWQRQLQKLIALYQNDYDFVVIDTPGSRVSIFATLALVAAHLALVPVKTTFDAQQATVDSVSLIEDLQGLNPGLVLWKIIPNQYEKTLHHTEVVDILGETYPGLVHEPSHKSIKYAEALVQRADIRELAPNLAAYWDGIAQSIIEQRGVNHASSEAGKH